MRESDLRKLIDIDSRITGRNRSDYFNRKLEEALYESDVRVSLVAERDGDPVGFIMARVDFGEFGRVEPIAVLDTIGVDPGLPQSGHRARAAVAAVHESDDAAGRGRTHRGRLVGPAARHFPRPLRVPSVATAVS